MSILSDEFSEIECFDAFMELQNSYRKVSAPSELENYINDSKAFFRAIHDMGVEEGFALGEASSAIINNLDDE